MIDYLSAVLLLVAILAMVLLTLVAFPHFALIVIPIAIGLMLPILLVAGPLLLVASLPFYIIGGLVTDVRYWREKRRARPPRPRRLSPAEKELARLDDLLVTLDEILGR